MITRDLLTKLLFVLMMLELRVAIREETTETEPVFDLNDESYDLSFIMRNGHIDYHVLQDELDLIEQIEEQKSSYTEPPRDLDVDGVDERNETRIKRFAIDKESRRWTHGIIPYIFDDSVDQSTRNHIQKDIFGLFTYWTHFRFVLWNTSVPELYDLDHSNYLIFIQNDNRCWSNIGNTRSNGQKISCCIKDRCVHELGHSLGFYHEIESPLRDNYIRINSDNIEEGVEANFQRSDLNEKKVFGYYDMSSVMGYSPNTFSKNHRDTITIFDPETTYLTIQKDMSAYYMFYEAQKLYHMQEEKCPTITDDCKNGGYLSYVKDECRCRCPRGLLHSTNCSTVIGEKTCGGVIELSSDNKYINITSPNFPQLYQLSRSCLWFIKGPKGSKIKADFDDFDLPSAKGCCPIFMEIGFTLPGQPGMKYCGDGFSKTIVSQEEYLSFYVDSTNRKAFLKFAASISLVEAEDMAYSIKDQGLSYHGNIDYTRDYQPCLHWDQVTDCSYHTFNVTSIDLEENYCRNPGHGTEPWCYVNAETCQRSYCDVSNLRTCRDTFENCEEETLKNPYYCYLDVEARRGCRQTCNFCSDDPEPVKNITCDLPAASINDGELVSDDKMVYNVGDIVQYNCSYYTSTGSGTSVCTSEGKWTYLGYVCQDNPLCEDKRSDCATLLSRNPTMCKTYKDFSTLQCPKTCGLCQPANTIEMKVECKPDWYLVGNVTVTSQGPYYHGDIVTFRCLKGYTPVVGDLQRACKADGYFTGLEPRCTAIKDTVTDLYHVSISRRSHTTKPNEHYMLSNTYYKIQRPGEIIAWEFYTLYPGDVYFQVWRPFGRSSRFRLLNSFHVEVTSDDRKVIVNVPVQQRISVKPGDVMGMYLPKRNAAGIMYDKCNTKYDPQGGKHYSVIKSAPWYVGRYYRMTPSSSCYLVSLSAKIGPTRKIDVRAVRTFWRRFLYLRG
ncbi:hypothetical protein ACF0H5_012864 [Mactra antiquata]